MRRGAGMRGVARDLRRTVLEDSSGGTLAKEDVFRLRAEYVVVAARLADIHDATALVQIRPLVLQLLETCLGRIIELKEELVIMESSEIVYDDNVLQKMMITPLDLLIRVGRILRRTREKERQVFLESVEAFMKEMQPPVEDIFTEKIMDENTLEGEAVNAAEDTPLASHTGVIAEVADGVSGSPEPEEGATEAEDPSTPVPAQTEVVEKDSASQQGSEAVEQDASPKDDLSTSEEVQDATIVETVASIAGEDKAVEPVTLELEEREIDEEIATSVQDDTRVEGEDVPPEMTAGGVRQEERPSVEELVLLERRHAVTMEKTMAFPEDTGMMVQEAIILIQAHERARQARRLFQREIAKGAIRELDKFRIENPEIFHKSKATITAAWRGYSVRRKLGEREKLLGLLVGFYMPHWISEEQQKKVIEVQTYWYEIQEQQQREYEESQRREREWYLEVEAPWVMEDMIDEVREWFIDWYREANTFPDYPPGGSIEVSTGQAVRPDQQSAGQDVPEEAKKTPIAAQRQDGAPVVSPETFLMRPSKFLSDMFALLDEYQDVWEDRNEIEIRKPQLRMDILREAKRLEVDLDLRVEVDRLMKLELEVLKAALQRDREKIEGRRARKAGRAKKARRAAATRRKGRAVRDLTEGIPTEELYSRLLSTGIIRGYRDTDLTEFIGEVSFTAFELRQQRQNPLHSPGDVVQALLDIVVMPLSSERVRRMVPLTRSVCLMGPQGCGKTLLVEAICSEVGATLFDLSAENLGLVEKGSDALAMLMHLVGKLSRLLQPSVILVENTERLFYRRVPENERLMEPTRLRNALPRLVKSITSDDRVILIGTTTQPWAAQPGPFVRLYQRYIVIPPPDYATAFMFWKKILMRYPGVPRDFDVSALARTAQGYTIGTIREAVETVMTPARIVDLALRPLRASELLEELLWRPRASPADVQKLLDWYHRNTPLGKKAATKVLQQGAPPQDAVVETRIRRRGR